MMPVMDGREMLRRLRGVKEAKSMPEGRNARATSNILAPASGVLGGKNSTDTVGRTGSRKAWRNWDRNINYQPIEIR
jgi:hypothetical protein